MMKKQMIYKHINARNIFLLVIFLGLVIFGTTSCEKIPKFYLKKWIGSYDCEEVYSWWTMSGSEGEQIYQTKVEVTAIGDCSLKITENRKNTSFEVIVKKDGSFDGFSEQKQIDGNFNTDSLDMYLIWGRAQGFKDSSHFKGKKLNKK